MFVYTKTPTIAVVDGVVTPEECQSVIKHSEDKLERSTVATAEGLVSDEARTSHGTWLPHDDFSEITQRIENGGQRLLTAMVYLNNAVGGGTAFPKLNIIVGSIGGRLLLFGNVDENNQPHELSLHQGLPPHEGEKWVMTLWFRENKIH